MGDDFDLALPVKRDLIHPSIDGCAPYAERPCKRRLAAKMVDSLGFSHNASSLAWHTLPVNNAIHARIYSPSMAANTITDRIREAFNESEFGGALGQGQAALARRVGVSKQTVGDWLVGRSVNIRPDNLFDLADVLRVEARWLATGKGPKRLPAQPSRSYLDAALKLEHMPTGKRNAFLLLINQADPPG